MYLKNTSRYGDEGEVRRLLVFASEGFDLRGVAVHLKNSRGAYRGLAYPRVPRIANAHKGARYLVTLGIGPDARFPADNLRQSVRWVEETGAAPPYGTPEYRQWWQGRRSWTAYRGGVETSGVQVRIVEFTPYGGKGSPFIRVADWREALVAVAAHEFTHIHQFQNNLPRSEVHAETAAAKRLDAYRRATQ